MRTRYDKRFCSHAELGDWYTPGAEPIVFEINGVRFGCAICLELRFPAVFDEYRRFGVHCVLVSTFTAARIDKKDAEQDNIFATTAQAYPANNSYWVSLVTPSNPFQGPVIQLIDPLGTPIAKTGRHRSGLALGQIDIGAGSLRQKIELGRAWRDAARAGGIYRERHAATPRSRARHAF